MVERVEGFAKKKAWKRAYREINELERQLVDDGTRDGEVLPRTSPRTSSCDASKSARKIPTSAGRSSADDWRNREHWDEYVEAAEEMFAETSTD